MKSKLSLSNRRQPLIELENIYRSYTSGDVVTHVLKGISLTIQQGEMVAIVGTSGSGKSTLMNIIGCLDSPDYGSISICGLNVNSASSIQLAQLRSQHIGFIFQRYHLMSWLSAIENVMVPAQYTSMPMASRKIRAKKLLEKLGLSDRAGHKPAQLSGGQQQRVSIARSLMNGAEIILADEPTGALDSVNSRALMTLLRNLHKEGHTIILITHDPQIAHQAERIIEISDGLIISDNRTFMAPFCPSVEKQDANKPAYTGRLHAFQNIKEIIKGAWYALLGHRLRTFLSMLGIVIGISSVVSCIALGEGTQKNILRQISQLGTHTLEIRPGLGWDTDRPDLENSLSLQDVEQLSKFRTIDSISPVITQNVSISYNGSPISASLSGVSNSFFRVKGMRVNNGHYFSQTDIDRQIASVVINNEIRNTLFNPDENPVGKIVQVDGIPFRIDGIIATGSSGLSQNNPELWMPYTSLTERLSGEKSIESILLRLNDRYDSAQTEKRIENFLIKAHGRKDFFIQSNEQITRAIREASDSMTFLITAIAAISLIVGGVGVMNIMLVSVIERTHEIGIRLSVGARPRDIMQQFMIESILICVAGGAGGILLSFLTGFICEYFTPDFTMIFSWKALLVACSTSVFTGLVFGFIPARNAAHLQPTQALAR